MTFLACAALLTSAVAFTGCKGDNQNEPQAEVPAVKTEFSIALPNQLNGGNHNRMPGATVQANGISDFQGMTNITLIPYSTQGSNVNKSPINPANDRLGTTNITLSSIAAAGLGTNSYAKVYENVSIPLTTASFLFYAKSSAPEANVTNKFNNGSLLPKNSSNAFDFAADDPAILKFALEPIKSDYANSLLAENTGGKLLAYLNSVAAATDGTKAWYAYTDADNAAMAAMFATYSSLKYLSSFGVARVMSDLYKSLEPLDGSSTLAHNIRLAINNTTTYVDNITNDVVTLKDALNEYPAEINLPDGAISIKWVGSTTNKFVEGDYPNMTLPQNFVYPAHLWYYVNSIIRTSNTSKKTMYDNSNNWSTILNAHQNATAVNSLTRAVAVENAIQYGVARFDVTVKLDNNSLADNSDHAEGIAKAVDVTAGFPVTAVFIGGQGDVQYDFTCPSTGNYTIYDKKLATPGSMTATTSATAVNHTLVLETVQNTKVRVAIEMRNDLNVDFYGFEDQLIPKGGKFYVVAELDPSAATGDNATETDHKVFKQDFKTTANLTLKNLRKAYSTLPDLRTPQLELGFSVDLTWQNGHTYDVDFE